MDISAERFGELNGEKVNKITLTNDNGVAISCLTMGALWHEFLVPAADGTKQNLILNYNTVAEYYSNGLCTNQVIGRVAGRIKNGKCEINGEQVTLPQNENGNTLHGGPHGFNTYNWSFTTSANRNSISVIFQKQVLSAVDGFPGDILVTVIYTLDNSNNVTISFNALGDDKVDTLFNPTNHVYFNLSNRSDLASHELKINSDGYLELDEKLIPTGRIRYGEGTAYDFTKGANLYEAIQQNEKGGFDDAFIVNGPGKAVEPIAVLRDTQSGNTVTIDSDRNSLIMYTMNDDLPDVHFKRDNGRPAKKQEGVALEAQTLPDAINQETFGDIVLPRGAKRSYHIKYTYSNDKN